MKATLHTHTTGSAFLHAGAREYAQLRTSACGGVHHVFVPRHVLIQLLSIQFYSIARVLRALMNLLRAIMKLKNVPHVSSQQCLYI